MKHEHRHEQAPDPHDLDRNLRLEESAITTELDRLREVGDEDTDGFLSDRLTEILEDIADEDRKVRIYIGQEQANGADSSFFKGPYLVIEYLSWGTYATTNEGEMRVSSCTLA